MITSTRQRRLMTMLTTATVALATGVLVASTGAHRQHQDQPGAGSVLAFDQQQSTGKLRVGVGAVTYGGPAPQNLPWVRASATATLRLTIANDDTGPHDLSAARVSVYYGQPRQRAHILTGLKVSGVLHPGESITPYVSFAVPTEAVSSPITVEVRPERTLATVTFQGTISPTTCCV